MYRSMLYVPAHVERFVAGAHQRDADAIILDLEDAVPEPDKDGARAGLPDSVARVGSGGAAVFVRINSGARSLDDASAAKAAGAAGLVVAKADPPSLLALAAVGMPLLPILESPAAILDARQCARSQLVIGLMVGGEDLATALGGQPTPEVLRFPKLLVHYAAKAENKLSIGMLRSIADYADLDGIEKAAEEARMHGFDGAACIHPSAVAILNRAFLPSADEIDRARRIIAAAAQHSGAFVVDGHMVDLPIIERARETLKRASAAP